MSVVVDRARALRMVIESLAQDNLDDTEALENTELFPAWDGNGHGYAVGERFRYEGILYKTKQAHTSQTDWTPDVTASLYEQVAEEGQGTKNNPIPYNNNMALEEGKYYSQYNVLYYCFRSTGVAVHNDLSALIEIYVNEVVD